MIGIADSDTLEDDKSYGPDPENTGCEHFDHVPHNDEMALQCELGLYLDFKTKDGGFPYGCPGFDNFKPQHVPKELGKFHWIQMQSNIPWDCPQWWGLTCVHNMKESDPLCNLMTLQIPEGSTPMHEIFEEYASDNTKWIADFIPAMEKMLANGYERYVIQALQCPLFAIKFNCLMFIIVTAMNWSMDLAVLL